jgi:hypothetical protein
VPGTTPEPDDGEIIASPFPEETVLPITMVPTPSAQLIPESTESIISTTPQPTWTPLDLETPMVEPSSSHDWPVLMTLALQGIALLLGVVVFLKRR